MQTTWTVWCVYASEGQTMNKKFVSSRAKHHRMFQVKEKASHPAVNPPEVKEPDDRFAEIVRPPTEITIIIPVVDAPPFVTLAI